MEKEKNEISSNIAPSEDKNKKSEQKNDIEEEPDSPINLKPLFFTSETNITNTDNINDSDIEVNKLQNLPSSQDKKADEKISFIYDKYSKRIIYFDAPKKTILIYNRTKSKLIRKLQVAFDFKVLNACVNKELTYLLIFANPNLRNRFIFVYNIEKETFVSQLKEDFSYFLSFFFIEKNTFCLVFVDKIMMYKCNMENDEVKKYKTLDYGKDLISNFFFVRQYLILLIQKDDNSFDMYSLRKNEIELLKNFNKVFNTKNSLFKSKGFFSNLFSSKIDKKTRQIEIIKNFNNAYGNIYKSSQFFLEFIYSNIFFILLSYDDNAIFMMKIKNINKFPKEEDGNRIIKLEYKNHNNNSTIQFMDNLLFVHNFSTDTTIIYDIALRAKEKIICYSKNILRCFHSESFFKLNIIGGNIEETGKSKNEKGEQEIDIKLYSLNLNLENLFKNNENKNRKNLENEVELDGMLMIARRNKSKIFFLELFGKMLLDKSIKHRTEKMQLLLNEFSRQIQKSDSLAKDLMNNAWQINDNDNTSKAVKLSYKKENEKFYLDDKYIMLSTKNTVSQIEVIRSFQRVAQLGLEKKINLGEDAIFEFLFYILFFYIQLFQNNIEMIKLYYDTILILIKQIKSEKKIIELISYFSNEKYFPFGSVDIAKYLLDNFNHPLIRVEAYKILNLLKAHNELFYYLLKNEGFESAIEFLKSSFEESNYNYNQVKKVLIEYLKDDNDKNERYLLIEELAQDEEDM